MITIYYLLEDEFIQNEENNTELVIFIKALAAHGALVAPIKIQVLRDAVFVEFFSTW